jgi:hypothetical protein
MHSSSMEAEAMRPHSPAGHQILIAAIFACVRANEVGSVIPGFVTDRHHTPDVCAFAIFWGCSRAEDEVHQAQGRAILCWARAFGALRRHVGRAGSSAARCSAALSTIQRWGRASLMLRGRVPAEWYSTAPSKPELP